MMDHVYYHPVRGQGRESFYFGKSFVYKKRKGGKGTASQSTLSVFANSLQSFQETRDFAPGREILKSGIPVPHKGPRLGWLLVWPGISTCLDGQVPEKAYGLPSDTGRF
jgi:hypothetical protein